LYSSPNIIFEIKSGTFEWVGHVACMGIRKMHIGFLLESINEKDHLEDLGTEGRIILKRILKKYDNGLVWFHLAQDRTKEWVVSNIVMKRQVS
jgi:hypothetical protein